MTIWGRVTEVKSPDNGRIRREYWGSSVRIFDQSNRSRAGVSDALGRLTKVVEYDDGADLETFYSYDVLGRLRKTVQGGQSRYFMYNDLGRLIRAKQPEQNANASFNLTDPITENSNWSVKYEYDNNGNVVSTTDSRNITITGTYDNLNRLTLRDYSDATPDVGFTFDDQNIPNSKGQLTAVVSSVSANYYTAFDELGRVKSSSQVTNGQTYNFPSYVYDLSGALVEQTYPSLRVVKTESDNLGRLSKVTSQIPNQAERTYLSNLTYTAFGAVSQLRLGNGRWESTGFDAKTMQVTQIGLGYSIGDTSQLKIEYNYGTTTATTSDNNGSLRQQKISYAGQSAPIFQDYTYDQLNRLKSATETVNGSQTWKQTFLYDRFGNRRFDAANTTTLPQNNGVYNPQIDASTNKFLVSEGYNYDAEGNLTSNPENQLFAYDANNRQTQVTNTASQTTANYFYDGSGKRVRKLVGQEETIFVYDAFGKMVAEYSTMIDTSRPKTISYLTTDTLGSPRIITDGGGFLISRHDYMPFGEEVMANIGGRTTAQGYQANDGVRQQFTGYERDTESGLDYAQNRYFASKHGRFTSVDPLTASANIKNPQTFNRYTYALNSPYKFTDPLGLSPCGVGTSKTGVGRVCTQEEESGDGDETPIPYIEETVEIKIEKETCTAEFAICLGEDEDDPPVFDSDESPTTHNWVWDVSRQGGVACQGPGGVCMGWIYEFTINLDSDSNKMINDLYAKAFSYYYSMEILDSIKGKVGGELGEVGVTVGGKIAFTGDKEKPISGEINGQVSGKITYYSVQNLKANLVTALEGKNFTNASKKLQQLEFTNLKNNQTEKVTASMARSMVGYVKAKAREQAKNAAREWIRKTSP